MVPNYYLSCGLNKCETLEEHFVEKIKLQHITYVSILSEIARRTEELSP